jgi:hypothetical protein
MPNVLTLTRKTKARNIQKLRMSHSSPAVVIDELRGGFITLAETNEFNS